MEAGSSKGMSAPRREMEHLKQYTDYPTLFRIRPSLMFATLYCALDTLFPHDTTCAVLFPLLSFVLCAWVHRGCLLVAGGYVQSNAVPFYLRSEHDHCPIRRTVGESRRL